MTLHRTVIRTATLSALLGIGLTNATLGIDIHSVHATTMATPPARSVLRSASHAHVNAYARTTLPVGSLTFNRVTIRLGPAQPDSQGYYNGTPDPGYKAYTVRVTLTNHGASKVGYSIYDYYFLTVDGLDYIVDEDFSKAGVLNQGTIQPGRSVSGVVALQTPAGKPPVAVRLSPDYIAPSFPYGGFPIVALPSASSPGSPAGIPSPRGVASPVTSSGTTVTIGPLRRSHESYSSHMAHGALWTVPVTIVNRSSKTVPYATGDFSVLTAQDAEYVVTYTPHYFNLGHLKPGQSFHGELGFETPASAPPVAVEWHNPDDTGTYAHYIIQPAPSH